MKKAFYSSFVAILLCLYATAQTYDTTQFSGKMNYIFQYVNKTPITTNILRDYGIDFLNQSNYNGIA